MKTIKQVLKNNMCSGCGLCVSQPSQMSLSPEGYLRPQYPIDDDLSQSCPSINLTQSPGENYHPSWGPILSSQVGYAGDPKIRRRGSSGGVITALTHYCLSNQLVDGVITVGASQVNPIQNQVYIVTQADKMVNYAGSRYAPSAPLSLIRQLFDNGKTYAFVGKPCDVAALRSLLKAQPSKQAQFPYLISFMCAGVPSQKGTEKIIQTFGFDGAELDSFTYRGDGWPGLTKATTKTGESKTMTYNEAWGKILNQYLQPRCKLCVDGTGEFADIVCADAWHESNNGYPDFEEKDGRSLILVRTKEGQNLLQHATIANAIEGTEPYPISQLQNIQPYQFSRKSTLFVRLLALKILLAKTPKYQGFKLLTLTKKTPYKNLIKAFLGTWMRKWQRRL